MGRSIAWLAAILALTTAQPAFAAEPATAPPPAAAQQPQPDPLAARVAEAEVLVATGRLADAVAVLDKVIAEEASLHAGETRRIYAARSLAETLAYMAMAAGDKRDAVALDRTWAEALFLKGFVMVDLKRPEEARQLFEQAIAMSPLNARYLGELGEYHKARRDWGAAFEVFSRAAAAAELSPPDVQSDEQRRAWRGMGFALIEQGKLEEAEAMFQRCLTLDPGDARAQNELAYIRQQRARAAPPPLPIS